MDDAKYQDCYNEDPRILLHRKRNVIAQLEKLKTYQEQWNIYKLVVCKLNGSSLRSEYEDILERRITELYDTSGIEWADIQDEILQTGVNIFMTSNSPELPDWELVRICQELLGETICID